MGLRTLGGWERFVSYHQISQLDRNYIIYYIIYTLSSEPDFAKVAHPLPTNSVQGLFPMSLAFEDTQLGRLGRPWKTGKPLGRDMGEAMGIPFSSYILAADISLISFIQLNV